jgi:hypothetical protein
MFLRYLLPTLECHIIYPTPTYEDNEKCIALATNDITTSKTNHATLSNEAPTPSLDAPHPTRSRILSPISLSLYPFNSSTLDACLAVPTLDQVHSEYHRGVLVPTVPPHAPYHIDLPHNFNTVVRILDGTNVDPKPHDVACRSTFPLVVCLV